MPTKRWLLGINGTALVLSGILLYLMAVRMVAPLLGLGVLLVLLVGPLLVPYKASGMPPEKAQTDTFCSTLTERMEIL